MKIAIIGATGMVGRELIEVLYERKINNRDYKLFLAASDRSNGKIERILDKEYKLQTIQNLLDTKPDFAFFCAGGAVSAEWAYKFSDLGTVVIDKSSHWRMHDDWQLIVPEVNAHLLSKQKKLIANPNCSTIPLAVAIAPIHKRYHIKRLIINTYQAVSGSGRRGVEQLLRERTGNAFMPTTYSSPIDLNVIPHIDVFLPDGYTKEEKKIIDEIRKILQSSCLLCTATTVRVPVLRGHSISVNIEMEYEYELSEIHSILKNISGVVISDDYTRYPTPKDVAYKDTVHIGRLRRDDTLPSAINMWIVADNLRKGAATNAVQILEYINNL
jgi:aspartate-semialdehyde dehydrogenase